jgi:hypothetical protein
MTDLQLLGLFLLSNTICGGILYALGFAMGRKRTRLRTVDVYVPKHADDAPF